MGFVPFLLSCGNLSRRRPPVIELNCIQIVFEILNTLILQADCIDDLTSCSVGAHLIIQLPRTEMILPILAAQYVRHRQKEKGQKNVFHVLQI